MLLLIQAGVVAIARQKILVFAEFYDTSAIEYCNLVGVADG